MYNNEYHFLKNHIGKKYDKKDDGIEVEVEVSVRPVFDLEGIGLPVLRDDRIE